MRVLTLIVALTAGVTASQAPEFAQQYRQRLGGAIDELNRIIENFDADSAASGESRAGALAVLAANDAQLVRDQGLRMAETIVRQNRLVEQQKALTEGAPFERLAALVRGYDATLVKGTFDSFEPAVPTTPEGGVFAAVGFGVIYGFIRMLGLPFRRRRRMVEASA